MPPRPPTIPTPDTRLFLDVSYARGGDDYSARYRLRLDASREFTFNERPVVPYANVEWFYDTRYSSWSRTLYQAGAEFTVNRSFRFELYLAHQVDTEPSPETVDALGLAAKWYF